MLHSIPNQCQSPEWSGSFADVLLNTLPDVTAIFIPSAVRPWEAPYKVFAKIAPFGA